MINKYALCEICKNKNNCNKVIVIFDKRKLRLIEYKCLNYKRQKQKKLIKL